MKNEFIERMEQEIAGRGEDPDNPLHPLISVLKTTLKEYPILREQCFSENSEVKEKAISASQWIMEHVDGELRMATKKTGLTGEYIFSLLYNSKSLSKNELRSFVEIGTLCMAKRSLPKRS